MIKHDRWTPKRKKAVMVAIQRGEFTREAFMVANNVSADEMGEWDRGFAINNFKVSATINNLKARRPC